MYCMNEMKTMKEAIVMLITLIIVFNLLCNFPLRTHSPRKLSAILPTEYSNHNILQSGSSDITFTSRYITEFEPISCLGKGGFGVVFEAKKKFDECNYAIKRITLPKKPEAKDRMMREVKALAKLDHRNIVRYYNAWLEYPPVDWKHHHDQQWLREFSSLIETSRGPKNFCLNNDPSALTINVEPSHCYPSFTDDAYSSKYMKSEGSSSLIFQHNNISKSPSIVFESNSDVPSVRCSQKSPEIANQYYPANNPPVYLYIQMQLCCKESLKDWLGHNHSRERIQALDIFGQIVEAVEYVHSSGLIHRDLKPSNIFFSLEGQIKVGDFGLVTSIKEYSDSTDGFSPSSFQKNYTNAVGTQLYMSPEQLSSNHYDYKVDIYSLGIILFELLVSFNTEMERLLVLKDLKKDIYPKDFCCKFHKEHELLILMLSYNPNKRPNAGGVRDILTKIEATPTTND